MNLGDVYIKSAVVICASACLLSLLIALIVRHAKKTRLAASLLIFAVSAFVLCVAGCYFGHGPLFAAWHRSQNTVLPSEGCLTYQPSFFRLRATYRINRGQFDNWAMHHPWQLAPMSDAEIPSCDVETFGLGRPEAAYVSKQCTNGQQLRVYYANGTMYVGYYAM
jgi:hypothetical protein